MVLLLLVGEIQALEISSQETPNSANLDDLVRMITSYFPPLSGVIERIDPDGTVEISLSSDPSGLAEGVLLSIYRLREPFYHPVTGIELGRYEEDIGPVEVHRLTPNGATGKRVNRSNAFKAMLVGDRVRVPMQMLLRLEISSFLLPSGALIHAMTDALSATDRFRFAPAALAAAEPIPATADYVLSLSATEVSWPRLHLQMYNTQTHRLVFSTEVALTASDQDAILEQWTHSLFEQGVTQKP